MSTSAAASDHQQPPPSPNLGLRQHTPGTMTSSTPPVGRGPFSSSPSAVAGGPTTPAPRRTKYLLVVGGVCSSLGKGVTTSSIGALLRGAGFRVTACKIDPYINPDAGLMSPAEHGECYVLRDGGEVDLDLGNYERWVGLRLGRDHNITTGKVYQALIAKERRGEFLGKTVQVVPHFTNFVQDHIRRVATMPTDGNDDGTKPDICLIELGGTVGDIESAPFTEALRQLRFSLPPEDFLVALVTYLPVMGGQQKTKPTQHTAKTLMSLGMLPDFLFCRSSAVIEQEAKAKLSHLVGVKPKYIFSAHDVKNLYEIPGLFHAQHVVDAILHKFHLAQSRYETPAPPPAPKNAMFPSAPQGSPGSGSEPGTPQQQQKNSNNNNNSGGGGDAREGSIDSASAGGSGFGSQQQQQQQQQPIAPPSLSLNFPDISDWARFAHRLNNPKKTVRIAFVGKYVNSGSDAYFSVMQAFEHCALTMQVKLDLQLLDPTVLERQNMEDASGKKAREALTKMDGIFVPGGFGTRAFAGKCEAAQIARDSKVPFFGVCYGFQAAVVAFARSTLSLEDANSEECDTDKTSKNHVIRYMPDIDRETMGANMRLGAKPAFIAEPTPETGKDASSSSSSSSSYKELCEKKPSLAQPSLLKRIYGGVDAVMERHRHRFEFNRRYLAGMQRAGLRFTAASDPEYGKEVRVEALELPVEDHPHYLATQYHPEFESSSFDPSPPFLAFVAAAAKMPLPGCLSRPTSRRYVPEKMSTPL